MKLATGKNCKRLREQKEVRYDIIIKIEESIMQLVGGAENKP